jgi:hypothetical protein
MKEKTQQPLKKKSNKFKPRFRDQELRRKQKLLQQRLNRAQKLKDLKSEYPKIIEQKCNDLGTDIEGLKFWGIFADEQTYVNQEIAKWDEQQLRIPTGKYRDAERIYATYQQKFMEAVIEFCPQAIEELKKFIPYFAHLFDKKDDTYYDVFQELKRSRALVESHFHRRTVQYDPVNHPFNHSFYWGEYSYLLRLIDVKMSISKFPEDLSVLNLSEEDTQLIENFKNTILLEKYNIETSERGIIKAFAETATNQEDCLTNFLKLQNGLISWAYKYHLEKDWLIDYAHYIIWQFSKNADLKITQIETNPLNIRSLEAYPFEFRARGWRAGDETKEEYEEGLTIFFLSKLDEYFDSSYRQLNLEKIKKITSPVKYENVKWLVWETVLGWDREETLQRIDEEQNQAESNIRRIDPTTVIKAFEKFKKYDLPFREKS